MKKIDFKWDGQTIQWIEVLIQSILLFFSYWLVLFIVDSPNGGLFQFIIGLINNYTTFHTLLVISVFLSLRSFRASIAVHHYVEVSFRIAISIFITFLVAIIYHIFRLIPSHIFTMLIGFIMGGFLILLFEAYFGWYLGLHIHHVVMIVGPKKEADVLARKLLDERRHFRDVRFVYYQSEQQSSETKVLYECLKQCDQVYLTKAINGKIKDEIVSFCFRNEITFFILPDLYELVMTRASIGQVEDVLTYQIRGLRLTAEQQWIKRSFDIIVSLLSILILTPVWVVIAVMLKLSEPNNPVLYRQERVTIHGKIFWLYKFRTMLTNAESATGPVLSMKNDPRITPFGRFLRNTKLDETPQFVNILLGDMSVIGPRPEREYFTQKYLQENPNYQYRMNIRAGLTGLAQSMGRYHSNFNDKLTFDLLYISNYSFISDMTILFRTVKAIIDGTTSKTEEFDSEIDLLTYLDNSGIPYINQMDICHYIELTYSVKSR
jgi:exopolysaccharide biosynthesis polyprenyl glycosylphosphotransferase